MNDKSPKASYIETRYIVMPQHANHCGTAFGGVVMSWIDIAAAMTAEKHSQREVVTVSIDTINFLVPILIGDHVLLQSTLRYVGTSSMEIEVQVFKENPGIEEQIKATTAYLTFVALDNRKKPVKIPGLILETEEEKKFYERAVNRVKARKELKDRLK